MKFLFLLLSFQSFAAVNFVPVEYYTTKDERVKILKASLKVSETIDSQCFGDFILNRKMNTTNNRTPAQVLEHLRSLNGEVPVRMYYRCMKRGIRCPVPTSAVAYRNTGEGHINLNQAKFVKSLSDCRWASTLGHESLGHSLGGYGHTMNWTSSRDYTVPYSINAGFERCCK